MLPGQTAAFVSHFGRADCTTKPSRTQAPRRGERRTSRPAAPRRRARAVREAADERLRRAAAGGRREPDDVDRASRPHDDGVPFYPGTVDLRRDQVPGEPVTVVDLGGSILFSVLPAEGRRLRPVTPRRRSAVAHRPHPDRPVAALRGAHPGEHLAAVPVQRLHPHGGRPRAPDDHAPGQGDPAAVVGPARPVLRHGRVGLTHAASTAPARSLTADAPAGTALLESKLSPTDSRTRGAPHD